MMVQLNRNRLPQERIEITVFNTFLNARFECGPCMQKSFSKNILVHSFIVEDVVNSLDKAHHVSLFSRKSRQKRQRRVGFQIGRIESYNKDAFWPKYLPDQAQLEQESG